MTRQTFNLAPMRKVLLGPLQWCVVLIGLSVPISVAFDNVLLALILLGVLFSLPAVVRIAWQHPVARAAMLLFTMLLAAMFYGGTPMREAQTILAKYADLAFIPGFIWLLSDEIVRRRARRAFIVAMGITLAASYLIGLKIVPLMSWMHPWTDPINPAIFHSHITQNNMMAFAVFLALLEWREATVSRHRIAWLAFVGLAIVNILFMVEGRTGYLILFVLLGWFAMVTFSHAMARRGASWGWRQKGGIALVLLLGVLLAYHGSARLHNRVVMAVAEYQAWIPNQGATSIGQRLDFYSNTLHIVAENPLLGVGTGGFPSAYERHTQGVDVIKTRNPHNEYLMISVQTGLVGLILLLYLFYTHWRNAPLLPTLLERDAARGLLLAYLVNCTLNSALMDHADGLFFAFMSAVLFANLKLGSKHE